MEENIPKNLGKRFGNTSELPDSLKKLIPEINISGLDEQIYDVLKNDLEGIGTISEILVSLYRKYQVLDQDRLSITRPIYKLIKKGLVKREEKRKGVYKIS